MYDIHYVILFIQLCRYQFYLLVFLRNEQREQLFLSKEKESFNTDTDNDKLSAVI